MTEYIEREAALASVRPDNPMDEQAAVTIATAKKLVRKALKNAPAADVVPVVRCRDCRKRGLPECPMETGEPGINSNEDGFCHRGAEWPPNLAEELKPCPFCGRTHIILRRESKHTSLYSCYCAACGATTGLCVSREHAIKSWNRRATHDD